MNTGQKILCFNHWHFSDDSTDACDYQLFRDISFNNRIINIEGKGPIKKKDVVCAKN